MHLKFFTNTLPVCVLGGAEAGDDSSATVKLSDVDCRACRVELWSGNWFFVQVRATYWTRPAAEISHLDFLHMTEPVTTAQLYAMAYEKVVIENEITDLSKLTVNSFTLLPMDPERMQADR
jgi:hypothetical protein